MKRPVRSTLRVLPKKLQSLAELATDLRWTWSHASDRLWNMIDPVMWERTQNPLVILQSIPQHRLTQLAEDPEFLGELEQANRARREYQAQRGWFARRHSAEALGCVAYFSMEFGIGEALPLYAGGLGVLAGDILKTASDLAVPVVGVGLLYQEGYGRQILDRAGWQIEAYPYNDPLSLPVRPVMPTGKEWLHIPLELPGRTLLLRVWQAQVGRVRLYLLDSNTPLNTAPDRGITSKLYDDRPEIRLLQEMALGFGGWRVIESLRLRADVCHLNEGHAAFAVIERAHSFMRKSGLSFEEALCATRAGNVFTTHTPVAAGFDVFSAELIRQYLRDHVAQLGISMEEFLGLGRRIPHNSDEPFTMTLLAMRGSTAVNGVSRLHGEVSRRLFQPLYPRWPEPEVPIGSITNGVHVPSWDSEWADTLWTKAAGKARWLDELETLAEAMRHVDDAELWTMRTEGRKALTDFARQRLIQQYRLMGADPETVQSLARTLDPQALTIGFARRFAEYKRPTLLLHNRERLTRLLTNPDRPVQLIVAGKAHPHDQTGKALVQQFVRFAREPAVRDRVIFLADYDLALAEYLVQGVDVWVNTPRRPWEACGTSGMKVLVNGGLNLSELDGWWAEAYSPEVGWALGGSRERPEADSDAVEAAELYDVLEQHVVPEFYDRDPRGIPVRWVARMRASMAGLAPRYSSNRMLREYVERLYLPAAARVRKRTADHGRLGKELLTWQRMLAHQWPSLRFGTVEVHREGDAWCFTVTLYLAGLDPAAVAVELYAEPFDGTTPVREPLAKREPLAGEAGWYRYQGRVRATRPAEHFTPRVIPAHCEAQVPLEESHILWFR